MSRIRRPVRLAAGALLALGLGAAAARAHPMNWNQLGDIDTIQILTTDEDGSTRTTTVWLAVRKGEGYVRTGNTHWGANLERNTEVVVRIAGTEYPLRATRIKDPVVFDEVMQVFRQKYGFMDALTGLLRGDPKIFRLDPRQALGS
jgi:hypothetical protein